MIKSGSLITAAILVFGLSAGSIALPQSAAAADVGAASSDAPKATHKHKSSHKYSHKSSHKKSKRTASAAK
jgi:hypothetical protein